MDAIVRPIRNRRVEMEVLGLNGFSLPNSGDRSQHPLLASPLPLLEALLLPDEGKVPSTAADATVARAEDNEVDGSEAIEDDEEFR